MRKKVRLLYLINSFVMGGAEKAMVRILSGLDKNKYDITAVSLQNRTEKILPELEKTGIDIIKLNATSKYDIMVAYKLYKFIKEFVPDVLICSLFHSTILGRITGALAKTPIIINWEHNENLGSALRRRLNRATISLSDRIFCDSEKVRTQVIKQLCPNENLVETIPIGGIDLAQYSCPKRKKSPAVTVGTVGMLTKQKGFAYLIEAAKLVSEKNANVKFSIVGDGPEFENLKNLIKKLQLEDTVDLLGLRYDIPDLLSKWDIYVQPSMWEGLCITIVEAMACGLPVLASNVGGIPESVFDGQNGFLVPPKYPCELATRISYLIENPDLTIAMGDQSRKIAEEKYCLHKMCRDIEESIDDLIKTKIGILWNKEEKLWQSHACVKAACSQI